MNSFGDDFKDELSVRCQFFSMYVNSGPRDIDRDFGLLEREKKCTIADFYLSQTH